MAASAQSPHVLDGTRIISTLEALNTRIEERFPGSGLSKVCADLTAIARRTEASAEALKRPYIGLRVALGAVIALAAGAVAVIAAVVAQQYDARENPTT